MSEQQGPGAGASGSTGPAPYGPNQGWPTGPCGQPPSPYGAPPSFGPPPPYGAPPPWGGPPPPHRRRGLIALVVAVVLVVLGGATVAGVVVLGGDDSSEADDSPDDDPTTDPTEGPTTGPTSEPTGDPTQTVAPGTPTGELAALESALRKRGFRCQLSFSKPVIVRTCYHDPYLPYGEAYLQTVVDAGGNTRWVDVDVHASGEATKVGRIFDAVLASLDGTLLDSHDVRLLRNRPNAPRLRLSWGSAETYRAGADYQAITLTKPGFQVPYIDLGAIRTSARDVLRDYAGKHYRCTVDPGFEAVDCQRRSGRVTYAVSALAPCVRQGSNGAVPCAGLAPSMTLFWGLDQNRITNAMMRSAVDRVFIPGAKVALGGAVPAELRSWLIDGMDGDYHAADFDGLHLTIEPNTAFTDRKVEVAVGITYVSPPS